MVKHFFVYNVYKVADVTQHTSYTKVLQRMQFSCILNIYDN